MDFEAVVLSLLCLSLFFMAAVCLAICCTAMIPSCYSNVVPWYCSHVIVIKLLLCCYILTLVYYHTGVLLYFRTAILVTSTLLFMLLRLQCSYTFDTIGYISH